MQGEATGRAIKLARLTKTPLYVVHVMSKDAAEEVLKGRATGQKVWGEVVAGAIGLTDQKWSVLVKLPLCCLPGDAVCEGRLVWGLFAAMLAFLLV